MIKSVFLFHLNDPPQGYLDTKRDRMDHMLEEEPLEGQFCFWDHDSADIWENGPGEPRAASTVKVASSAGSGGSKGDHKVSP